MGFFDKMKLSVGIGGAKVEIKLNPGPVPLGSFARGTIILKGGKAEQICNVIEVELKRTKIVRVTVDGKRQDKEETDTIHSEKLAEYEQTISPDSQMRFEFAVRIPNEGGAEERISYEVCASADIPGAIDPSDSVKVPLTKAAELTAASIPELLSTSQALYEQGSDKYAELEGVLAQVLKLDANNTAALKMMMQAVEYRNSAEAPTYFKRYLELVPGDAAAWNDYCNNAQNRDALEEALLHSAKAVGLAKQNSQYWENRARILDSLQRYDEAVTCLDQALQGDAQKHRVMFEKGKLLQKAGKKPQALAAFLEAGSKGDPYILGEILGALDAVGSPSHEEGLISIMMSANPNNHYARQVLAERLLVRGKHADTVKELDTILADSGVETWTRARVWVLKGKAFEGLQKKGEAKTAYQQALTFDKDNYEAKTRLKAI